MIWALGFLAAAAALAGLSTPWWWPRFAQAAALRRRAANVAAYRTRLDELGADARSGVLAPEALEAAKLELAARLLQDSAVPAAPALAQRPARGLLIALAIGLPAFAAAWYALAGTWRTQSLIDLARHNPELAHARALDHRIERLRDRVGAVPDDAEAWTALARSYLERDSFTDAAAAFARAGALRGDQDPDLLVAEGEALALTQGRAMVGAPAERFARALAIAPEHAGALWFAGIAAYQAGDREGAILHWERLLQQPLPDDTRATLEHSLAMMRERAGTGAGKPVEKPAPAPAPLALRIRVTLAPELADAAGPDDALFVFAQDPAGPPMPLAVQRLPASRLPATVTLDDSNSMTPERKLSSVDRWRVVARISRSGNAAPQPGDLEGSAEVGRAGAGEPVAVVISRRRP